MDAIGTITRVLHGPAACQTAPVESLQPLPFPAVCALAALHRVLD